uniref:Uncharacterized protein n=1 Tax=Rhizophora mucronata TaxID=61149 RepID=A0A2P2Q284_RHIMU
MLSRICHTASIIVHEVKL